MKRFNRTACFVDDVHFKLHPCDWNVIDNSATAWLWFKNVLVDPGGPVVIILASGTEVRGFDPGRGRLIFSERKNPEYDFLRKGSKAVGPVS